MLDETPATGIARPGWFRLENAVIDQAGKIIGPYGIALFAAIARHANGNGEAFPGEVRLAELTGMSKRQVNRQVKRLAEIGLVTIKVSPGKRHTYTIHSCPIVTSAPRSPLTNGHQCPTVTDQCPTVTTPMTIGRGTGAPQSLEGQPRKKTQVRTTKEVDPGEVPAALRTERFFDAWTRWDRHRKELRKPLTHTSALAQWKKLADMGHERAIAAINYSIEKNWMGIFEKSATYSTNGRASNDGTEFKHKGERAPDPVLDLG